MALGSLFVLFVIMALISIVGIVLLLITKNQTISNICFFGLLVWCVVLAYLDATSLPTNFIGEKIGVWVVAAVGVAGLPAKVFGKSKKIDMLANVMVIISVIVGMYLLFF